MIKMTVARWRGASPYLGIGTYYVRGGSEADPGHEDLVNVTLEAPLILDGLQVRMLVEKYGTGSPDRMTALAGAWTLRREVLQKGHDGIIAAQSAHGVRGLTLVALRRSVDKLRPTFDGDSGENGGARITRLATAERSAAHA